MAVFSFLFENWQVLAAIVGALLTLASLVTGLTPSPKDDEVVRKIAAFFSFLTPKDSAGTFKAPLTKAPVPVDPPLLQERPTNVSKLRLDD